MSDEVAIQIAVTISIVFYSILGPERFLAIWNGIKELF